MFIFCARRRVSDHGLDYNEFHPVKAGVHDVVHEHDDGARPDAGLVKLSREMSVKVRRVHSSSCPSLSPCLSSVV